jgi:hypothetical protein
MSDKHDPTVFADITGWGLTVDGGPKSYRHIPVQITPPGNVDSVRGNFLIQKRSSNIIKMTDDCLTLSKLEERIQADFKNGAPPHLQQSARDLNYVPGSDQSRIYVTSHSNFTSIHPRDIQRILRERLILVHDIPLEYDYGWDLESFGHHYDVDKKTNVHGMIGSSF